MIGINFKFLGIVGLWIAFMLFGCTYMRERAYEVITTPDNPIEEIVEQIIEQETGLDLDLTPSSLED